MASVQHATLVADTVTTLTFTDGAPNIEVTNVTGTASVYFTVDGSAPTKKGTNCQVLPATITSLSVSDESGGNTYTVKLISGGTPDVSVRTY